MKTTKLETELLKSYDESRLAFAGVSWESYLYDMYLSLAKKNLHGKANLVHCLYMAEKWSY